MAIMMMAEAMARGVVAVGSPPPLLRPERKAAVANTCAKTWQYLPQAPDPDLKRERGEAPEG